MTLDISEPSCSKCRWGKQATAMGAYADARTVIGIRVQGNGWNGIDIAGQHFEALGAVYCEHERQPRGLVLTNYACPNFQLQPVVDQQQRIDAGRLALKNQEGDRG